VVKVIRHKGPSLQQTDGSIVFVRWRQCARPRWHIGAIWRIRLKLRFLRPTRIHNPNGKSFGSGRVSNPHGAATTWVASANTWLVTCCGFLVGYTLFYIRPILRLAHRPILTIYAPQGVLTRKEVLFWGRDETAPFRRSNAPPPKKNGAWTGVFKTNSRNIETCILSKQWIDSKQVLHSDQDYEWCPS